MIWIQPAAAFALVALALSIAIHLLATHTARRTPFPTIRFIPPTRLASLRRRALDDVGLLAVRLMILGAAVAASAGPVVVTAARRRAWDARTVRVVIDDPRAIARAVADLQREPPGRREIVVRSAFQLGSIAAADVDEVPSHIGLRFERTGTLPSTRAIPANSVLTASAGSRTRTIESIAREITLNGDRTGVRDSGRVSAATNPVELSAPDAERPALNEIIDGLLVERLPAPAPGRFARIEFVAAADANSTMTRRITQPWMGDAAARIVGDALRRGESASAVRFTATDGRLTVATTMRAADARAPELVRSVFQALAPPNPPLASGVETLSIPDRQLTAWSRLPGPAPAPTPDMIREDDRRWFWATALLLLVVEWRIRRRAAGAVRLKADTPSPPDGVRLKADTTSRDVA